MQKRLVHLTVLLVMLLVILVDTPSLGTQSRNLPRWLFQHQETTTQHLTRDACYVDQKKILPVAAVEIVKKWEGFYAHAYPDPLSGGLPITIGWGTTEYADGSLVHLGDRISREEAEKLLILELTRDYASKLASKIPDWNLLNSNQKAALISFAYNLGADFYGSPGFRKISKVLKDKLWEIVEETMFLYRNPGTNVEKGLGNRRREEAKLFKQPALC